MGTICHLSIISSSFSWTFNSLILSPPNHVIDYEQSREGSRYPKQTLWVQCNSNVLLAILGRNGVPLFWTITRPLPAGWSLGPAFPCTSTARGYNGGPPEDPEGAHPGRKWRLLTFLCPCESNDNLGFRGEGFLLFQWVASIICPKSVF